MTKVRCSRFITRSSRLAGDWQIKFVACNVYVKIVSQCDLIVFFFIVILLPLSPGPGPGRYGLPPTIGFIGHDFTKPTSPAYSFHGRTSDNSETIFLFFLICYCEH